MNTTTATRVPSPDVAVERRYNVGPAIDMAPIIHLIERAARDPSVDIEKLRQLLEMRAQIEAKASETEFDRAMSAAQASLQPVVADENNQQARNSKYASYFALDRAIRPIYTANGFSLSFNTETVGEIVRVFCRLAHNAGYSRQYQIDIPADGKGARGGDVMTKTHATGSAVSYGMRYLLKMIFNIAVDADDDGNAASSKRSPENAARVPSAPTNDAGGLVKPHAFTAPSAEAWAIKFIAFLGTVTSAQDLFAWTDLNANNLDMLEKKNASEHKRVMAAVKARRDAIGETVTKDGEIVPNKSADGLPNAAADPDGFLKWADKCLSTVTDPEKLEPLYTSQIEPRSGELFPPDKEELQGLLRRHEKRLAP